MRGAVALCALVAATTHAAAQPAPRAPDLTVKQVPSLAPDNLGMRRRSPGRARKPMRAAAQGRLPSPPRPAGSGGKEDATRPPVVGGSSRREQTMPGSRLEDKIIFRFSIGVGMDGGQPSGAPPLAGGDLGAGSTYDDIRSYGFGDIVLGTRNLIVPGIGTYFAGEFRIDQNLAPPGVATGAVPSIWYHTDDSQEMLIRSGYAEAEGFFERAWLKPLTLRAGRQFKYGVTVAHFDGVTFGYETRPLTVSTWFGQRVSLYGFDRQLGQSPPEIGGSSFRLDLFELRRIPVVATVDFLNTESIQHVEYGLAFRWSRDVLIRSSVRTLDGDAARQTLSAGLRLSPVTTVNVELDNRTEHDWVYDLMALRQPTRSGDVRNYLNLGPPLPRLQLDMRAGTVLLRNLDVLLRGAAAIEHADGDVDGPFSPSYFEAGAAVEVRLRRNLRLGSTMVARRYTRDDVVPLVEDMDAPDPLRELGATASGDQIGEQSFYELGGGVDYSVGARKFNASAELYSRIYRHQTPYEDVIEGNHDAHSGGRFSVEGWAQSRIRIKAEYDVTLGAYELIPELRGMKMLRVLTEGTF